MPLESISRVDTVDCRLVELQWLDISLHLFSSFWNPAVGIFSNVCPFALLFYIAKFAACLVARSTCMEALGLWRMICDGCNGRGSLENFEKDLLVQIDRSCDGSPCPRNSQYLNVPSGPMGDCRRWPYQSDSSAKRNIVRHSVETKGERKSGRLEKLHFLRPSRDQRKVQWGAIKQHQTRRFHTRANANICLFQLQTALPQSGSWSIAFSACAAHNAQPVQEPTKQAEPAEPAEARKIRKAKHCRVGRVGPVGSLIGPFSFPKAWKSAHFSVRQYLARETLELQSVQPSLNTYFNHFQSRSIYFSSIRLLLSCCCRFVHHLWRFSTRWIFWGQSIANGSVSERLMNFSRLEGWSTSGCHLGKTSPHRRQTCHDNWWHDMTCLSWRYHVCSDMFRQFSHETWRHLQHFAQHIAAYWRSCTECWGDLCLCRVWLSAMHLEFKSFGSKSCSCNYSTLSMLQQYVVRSCPYSGNDRNCWKWLWTFQL